MLRWLAVTVAVAATATRVWTAEAIDFRDRQRRLRDVGPWMVDRREDYLAATKP